MTVSGNDRQLLLRNVQVFIFKREFEPEQVELFEKLTVQSLITRIV